MKIRRVDSQTALIFLIILVMTLIFTGEPIFIILILLNSGVLISFIMRNTRSLNERSAVATKKVMVRREDKDFTEAIGIIKKVLSDLVLDDKVSLTSSTQIKDLELSRYKMIQLGNELSKMFGIRLILGTEHEKYTIDALAIEIIRLSNLSNKKAKRF